MAEQFVLDASVTLAWLFNESNNADRIEARLAGAAPVIPWLWRLEVVNVILVKERRHLLTTAQSAYLLELLEDWDLEVIGEPVNRTLNSLAATARPYQLSAYDAVYLDLTMSLNLPLFTLDANLIAAAKRAGVRLIDTD